MKRIIFCILLSLLYQSLWATDYYFLATEDHLYENPVNWYPAYPGTHVGNEDRVLVMADMYLAGFPITVEGTMEIKVGARIVSGESHIHVKPNGVLDNAGDLLVHTVLNEGMVYNRVSARIHLFAYQAFDGARTHNSASATFQTIGNLINAGRFDNYSICHAGEDFTNQAIFYQMPRSQLQIRGNCLLAPGSILRQSRESVFQLGGAQLDPQAPTPFEGRFHLD